MFTLSRKLACCMPIALSRGPGRDSDLHLISLCAVFLKDEVSLETLHIPSTVILEAFYPGILVFFLRLHASRREVLTKDCSARVAIVYGSTMKRWKENKRALPDPHWYLWSQPSAVQAPALFLHSCCASLEASRAESSLW